MTATSLVPFVGLLMLLDEGGAGCVTGEWTATDLGFVFLPAIAIDAIAAATAAGTNGFG